MAGVRAAVELAASFGAKELLKNELVCYDRSAMRNGLLDYLVELAPAPAAE